MGPYDSLAAGRVIFMVDVLPLTMLILGVTLLVGPAIGFLLNWFHHI